MNAHFPAFAANEKQLQEIFFGLRSPTFSHQVDAIKKVAALLPEKLVAGNVFIEALNSRESIDGGLAVAVEDAVEFLSAAVSPGNVFWTQNAQQMIMLAQFFNALGRAVSYSDEARVERAAHVVTLEEFALFKNTTSNFVNQGEIIFEEQEELEMPIETASGVCGPEVSRALRASRSETDKEREESSDENTEMPIDAPCFIVFPGSQGSQDRPKDCVRLGDLLFKMSESNPNIWTIHSCAGLIAAAEEMLARLAAFDLYDDQAAVDSILSVARAFVNDKDYEDETHSELISQIKLKIEEIVDGARSLAELELELD